MTCPSPACFRSLVRCCAAAAVLACAGLAFAAEAPRKPFDVPADVAEVSLRKFSAQAGLDVLFATRTAGQVRTNALKGDFTPRAALDLLLADTGLVATADPKTGSLTVARDPNARRASPAAVTPTPSQTDNRPGNGDDALVLSPFLVASEKDEGYLAAATLAGSRLNTALIDTPASISVMTKDFLADIGATNVEEALAYSLNAEPDRTDNTGNPSATADLPIAIRGFSGATLGRNYFSWGLESDAYNTERLDFSRGPNSILFGTGGPGGIINTTTKRAVFGRDVGELAVRLASWDDYRATVDAGRPLGRTLAVRVNAVVHRQKSWRDFVGSERVGAALALTYRPFRETEIRFDAEFGDYDRVLTNPFLPGDGLTAWLAAGRPISPTYGALVTATARNAARTFSYDADLGLATVWFNSVVSNGPGSAASVNVQRALRDESVLPLRANLNGDGARAEVQFHSLSLFAEQRLGPVWLEAALNRQSSDRLWLSSLAWNNVVLRADPNARLPDGRPNPNVGRTYVEGTTQRNLNENVTDNLRFTATYGLDLTKRHAWLGSYNLSGLWSLQRSNGDGEVQIEVNTTPAGDALYPRDLTATNNRIVRRTYIDAFGPGRRGGTDARRFPVNQPGVVSGWVRAHPNQPRDERNDLTSLMFAGHARLLKDRLIVTGGWRQDDQANWASVAARDPVTRLWQNPVRDPQSVDFSGQTRTFGAVLHVTPWLAATYNESDNFAPQVGQVIDDSLLGPRRGVGMDYGLKFRLLGGRVYASVIRYETSERNRNVFIDGALISAINEIHEATGSAERVINTRDGIDTDGTGYEFELTANPTRQWRLTLNFAETEGVQSNNQPRVQAYVAARREGWLRFADRPLIAPVAGVPATDPTTGQPATVRTAVNSFETYFRTILGANGVTRRQLREYTGSFFAAYTFESDKRLLRGLTLGGGVRYRGAPVVGYSNGVDPLFGASDTLVNLLLRKQFKVFGRNVRAQANIDNLFDADDPVIADGDVNGGLRYLYPNPRRWSVSLAWKF